MGYIPMDSETSLIQKSLVLRKGLSELLAKHEITHVFVEEDLKKFTKGKSSAGVLQKLSRFNGMAMLTIFQLTSQEPSHLNVNNARRSVGCIIDPKDKRLTTKEKVMRWVNSALPEYPWPVKVVLRGKKKGEQVRVPQTHDMADAYVIARAGCKVLGC